MYCSPWDTLGSALSPSLFSFLLTFGRQLLVMTMEASLSFRAGHIGAHSCLLGLAMGCSNTFGLVTGAFLLGFASSDIPKSIWRNADWTTRHKVLSQKIAKMAVKLDDAHQISNAIIAFAFLPLMYMCICTYYSLFKVGMLMFYSPTPRQTSSVNLLMICSMVARYAPPISYNFLNLISLDEKKKTIFEKRMGNIDDAVPFFGKGFNKIYPLIMVIYTLLIACNFFDRIISFFGNWKIFKFQTEANDLDGFDSSGLIILRKERTWIEQGQKVGEFFIPLARNFIDLSMDLEAGSNSPASISC